MLRVMLMLVVGCAYGSVDDVGADAAPAADVVAELAGPPTAHAPEAAPPRAPESGYGSQNGLQGGGTGPQER